MKNWYCSKKVKIVLTDLSWLLICLNCWSLDCCCSSASMIHKSQFQENINMSGGSSGVSMHIRGVIWGLHGHTRGSYQLLLHKDLMSTSAKDDNIFKCSKFYQQRLWIFLFVTSFISGCIVTVVLTWPFYKSFFRN